MSSVDEVPEFSGQFIWSPDGSKLAHVADQDATGGGAVKISDPFPDILRDVYSLAWSPLGVE